MAKFPDLYPGRLDRAIAEERINCKRSPFCEHGVPSRAAKITSLNGICKHSSSNTLYNSLSRRGVALGAEIVDTLRCLEG